MVRNANDVAAAKAIELRDKRKPPKVESHDEAESFAALVEIVELEGATMINQAMKKIPKPDHFKNQSVTGEKQESDATDPNAH